MELNPPLITEAELQAELAAVDSRTREMLSNPRMFEDRVLAVRVQFFTRNVKSHLAGTPCT